MASYGTSTCTTYKETAEAAFALIAEAGFREIELSGGDGYFDRWEVKPTAFMRRKVEAAGLVVRTVHAHGPGWALADPSDAVRAAAVDAVTACLVHSAMLGAEFVIVHPNGWAGDYDRKEFETVRRHCQEDIATLAERARVVGIKMAVENMFQKHLRRPGCTVSQVLEMIDGLGDHVGICLDTGHSQVDGHSPAEEALLAGDKLFTLHIADNDGSDDQHRVPGLGTIDWPAFLRALDALGFAGPRVFEIGHWDSADDRELLAQQMAVVQRWESGSK